MKRQILWLAPGTSPSPAFLPFPWNLGRTRKYALGSRRGYERSLYAAFMKKNEPSKPCLAPTARSESVRCGFAQAPDQAHSGAAGPSTVNPKLGRQRTTALGGPERGGLPAHGSAHSLPTGRLASPAACVCLEHPLPGFSVQRSVLPIHGELSPSTHPLQEARSSSTPYRILPLICRRFFIPDPIANDVKYQAAAQPFLVFGLLTTGLAIGHVNSIAEAVTTSL